MKEPQFLGITTAGMGALGLSKSEVKLQLLYFNPNSFTGKMKWAEGEAWIDSVYMGPFRVDSLVVAKPNSEFSVPVTLTLNMKQALVFSTGVLRNQGKKEDILLRIEGRARAGRNGFYRNLPLKYEGRQKLEGLAL